MGFLQLAAVEAQTDLPPGQVEAWLLCQSITLRVGGGALFYPSQVVDHELQDREALET
jgi:hypothetical protein